MEPTACSNSSYIPCGDFGCILAERCCLTVGRACKDGAACYTASGTIDCYVTSLNMPTYNRPCYNYVDGGHACTGPEWTCRFCSRTESPYCSTEIYIYPTTTITDVGCWYYNTTVTYNITPGFTYTSTISPVGPNTTPTPIPSSRTTPTRITSYEAIPTPTITVAVLTLDTPTEGFQATDIFTPVPTSTTVTIRPPLSNGAIAGIAVGGISALAIIVLLGYFIWRRQPPPPPPPVLRDAFMINAVEVPASGIHYSSASVAVYPPHNTHGPHYRQT